MKKEKTQADSAYEKLLSSLVFLDYVPGQVLSEPALCEEIGLGRTPVREALKRLAEEGFVEFFPRRGIFVTRVDITQLSALYEYRRELEPIATRFAAAHVTPQVREKFEALIREAEDCEGLSHRELLELDARMHRAIFEASGNEYLCRDLTRIANLAARIWCVALPRIPHMHGHVAEHADILKAIMSGDGDEAARLVRAHVEEFEATVRSVL